MGRVCNKQESKKTQHLRRRHAENKCNEELLGTQGESSFERFPGMEVKETVFFLCQIKTLIKNNAGR